MPQLHLSAILPESIVDGPGIRLVVFAQGCPHHCAGCHNPHTWPFEGGFTARTEDILAQARQNPLVQGLTLSGGEPFCQAEGMAALAREAHASGYDIYTYTGYTFEELMARAPSEEGVRALLEQTDVLVDGPYIEMLKRHDLLFRGSSNQRMVQMGPSLQAGAARETPQ